MARNCTAVTDEPHEPKNPSARGITVESATIRRFPRYVRAVISTADGRSWHYQGADVGTLAPDRIESPDGVTTLTPSKELTNVAATREALETTDSSPETLESMPSDESHITHESPDESRAAAADGGVDCEPAAVNWNDETAWRDHQDVRHREERTGVNRADVAEGDIIDVVIPDFLQDHPDVEVTHLFNARVTEVRTGIHSRNSETGEYDYRPDVASEFLAECDGYRARIYCERASWKLSLTPPSGAYTPDCGTAGLHQYEFQTDDAPDDDCELVTDGGRDVPESDRGKGSNHGITSDAETRRNVRARLALLAADDANAARDDDADPEIVTDGGRDVVTSGEERIRDELSSRDRIHLVMMFDGGITVWGVGDGKTISSAVTDMMRGEGYVVEWVSVSYDDRPKAHFVPADSKRDE